MTFGMDRVSLSTARDSLDAPSEATSESFRGSSGANANSVAYLVYSGRGDPYSAGYKQPTSRDIPQVRLPRVEQVSDSALDNYISQVQQINATDDAGSLHSAEPVADLENALESVPSVFFDEAFELDNPRVFDAIVGDDASLLQEKLSWYVDVVEANLEHEIARASTKFFTATAQFGAIESQARATAQRIAEFKAVFQSQKDLVAHYRQTAALQGQLANATMLCGALEGFSTFIQTINDIGNIDEIDIDEAMSQVNAARVIVENGNTDFSRVIAAQPFIEKLERTEQRLRDRAVRDYAASMLNGLKATLSNSDSESSTAADSSSQMSAALKRAAQLDVRRAALEHYSQIVHREVLATIRKNLPSTADTEETQALARSLHSLSSAEADRMISDLFDQVITLLKALQGQNVPELGAEILANAVRTADMRVARIMRVRKDAATALNVPQFAGFFSSVTSFSADAELIAGVPATEIIEFLVAQTKLYVHALHQASDDELVAAIDADDWRRVEIGSDVQKGANIILDSGSMDPTDWNLESDINRDEGGKKGSSRISLDTQTFVISKSTTKLVLMILKYVQLTVVLPSAHVQDVTTSLIELLHTFNHKTHHQLLGFGALKTAGLKHISVRNLLLGFDSLRFVHALISPMKRCTERHLPQNSGTSSIFDAFDAVQQSYFDHRTEIQRKLVKLMSDKLSASRREIATTDWSVRAPTEANKYMLDLMRQTVTVAHVASELLPHQIAEQLVSEIYSVYKAKLLEAYSGIHIQSFEEKENVLRDLQYFMLKSEPLKGAGNTAEVIYESVNGFVAPDLTPPGDTPTPRTSAEDNLVREFAEKGELEARAKQPASAAPNGRRLDNVDEQKGSKEASPEVRNGVHSGIAPTDGRDEDSPYNQETDTISVTSLAPIGGESENSQKSEAATMSSSDHNENVRRAEIETAVVETSSDISRNPSPPLESTEGHHTEAENQPNSVAQSQGNGKLSYKDDTARISQSELDQSQDDHNETQNSTVGTITADEKSSKGTIDSENTGPDTVTKSESKDESPKDNGDPLPDRIVEPPSEEQMSEELPPLDKWSGTRANDVNTEIISGQDFPDSILEGQRENEPTVPVDNKHSQDSDAKAAVETVDPDTATSSEAKGPETEQPSRVPVQSENMNTADAALPGTTNNTMPDNAMTPSSAAGSSKMKKKKKNNKKKRK